MEPGKQFVHLSEPELEYVPGLHFTQSVPLEEYSPASHGAHDAAPPPEMLPRVHVAQLADPALE